MTRGRAGHAGHTTRKGHVFFRPHTPHEVLVWLFRLAPLVESVANGEMDESHTELLCRWLSFCTGRAPHWFDDLELDDFLALVRATFSHYHLQEALPYLQALGWVEVSHAGRA